jgi:hypothetical protein
VLAGETNEAFSRQWSAKEWPVGCWLRAERWGLTAMGGNKKAQPLGLGQELLKRMLLVTRPL